MMYKTDVAIQLIEKALNASIKAQYVLMDTWFTTEPMIGTNECLYILSTDTSLNAKIVRIYGIDSLLNVSLNHLNLS